jgi:hypothetical protein
VKTWWLTFYADDDTTAVAECSTDLAHSHPFLRAPEGGAEADVDLLRGQAKISLVNVQVQDNPTNPEDQSSGWLTAILADASGETARIGRRVKLEEADSPADPRVTVTDGVIGSVELDADLVSYNLGVRDIRERSREAKAFERGGTSTVWPRGVLNGYGLLPGGGWLQPPTTPARGTFNLAGPGWGLVKLVRTDATKPHLVLTQAMRDAVAPTWSEEHLRYELYGVDVLWRLVGGTTWTRLTKMEVWDPAVRSGIRGVSLFDTDPARIKAADGRMVDGDIIDLVHLRAADTGGVPANGAAVEVLVLHVGAPTKAYPFHFEGRAGELLRNLYRGDYSLRDPRIRYDEAALLALAEPVLLRQAEPVDDMREWVEKNIYQPLGAAPALNDAAEISPVRYDLPSVEADLPEFNDSNTAEDAGWLHDGDAVNRVVFSYLREHRVPTDLDLLGEVSAGDGIAEQPVTVQPQAGGSVALLGEQLLEIKPSTIRTLVGERGDVRGGDVQSDAGYRLALARGYQALDRFRFGGQYITARRMRSAGELKPGAWCLVSLSWLPDYKTRKRGMDRLAQVVTARNVGAWREYRLVDAGPANQPLAQPTLGTPTASADGLVSVPVTMLPVGGEARVDVAISDTLPATDSPLWTFLGRTAALATLTTSPQLEGGIAWVRARGEAPGRLRSALTTPVSVAIPAGPRVRQVRALIADDGSASAQATPNAYASGFRIFYGTHPAGTATPTLSGHLDVAATPDPVALPVTVDPGEALAIEVEPWTGWTGSAVSGTAGARVPGSALREAGGGTDTLFARGTATMSSPTAAQIPVQVDSVVPVDGTATLLEVLGSATLAAGPAVGVASPTGTVWTFNRGPENGGPGQALFRIDASGYVSDPVPIVIPEQGRDTVGLGLVVEQVAESDATVTVRAKAWDPYPQGASSVTVRPVGAFAGNVTPSTAQALTPTSSYETTAHVDFVIAKAPAGGGVRRVNFLASAASRVDGVDAVDVPAQDPEIPTAAAQPPVAWTELVQSVVLLEKHALHGQLGVGGDGPLEWRYRVETDTAAAATASAWSAAALPVTVTVLRDARQMKRLILEVRDADGNPGRWEVDVAPRQDRDWTSGGQGGRGVQEGNERGGMGGVPGRINMGAPVTTPDGVYALLNPLTRRMGTALLGPNGTGAADIDIWSTRAGLGFTAGGFVAQNLPLARIRPAVSLIGPTGRADTSQLTEDGEVLVDTATEVAALLDGGEVRTAADQALLGLTSAGDVLRPVPRDKALYYVPGMDDATGLLDGSQPVAGTGAFVATSDDSLALFTDGAQTVEYAERAGVGFDSSGRVVGEVMPFATCNGYEFDAISTGGARAEPTLAGPLQFASAVTIQSLNLARGVRIESGVDGQVVTFSPALPAAPAFAPLGGIGFHPDLIASPHGAVVEAVGLDTNGFTLRAVTRAAVGTITARSASFSGEYATKSLSAQAYDDRYIVNVSGTVYQAAAPLGEEPIPGSLTLYFLVNTGSGEILRAERTISNSGTSPLAYSRAVEIALDGVGSGATFRVWVAATTGLGGTVARNSVTWGEASAPAERSMGAWPVAYLLANGA